MSLLIERQQDVIQQNEDRMYQCVQVLSIESKPILVHLMNMNNIDDLKIDAFLKKSLEIKTRLQQ